MSRVSLPLGSLVAWSAVAMTALVVAWSLPIDDFWLTLASGRAIVQGADIATALPFSWTEHVPGALNPQWGAQMVLGASGSLAVALAIHAALLVVGIWATVMRARRRASGIAVAVALLLTLTGLAPHLLARAQTFSIALFPLCLLLLERFGNRLWLPLAYGVLMITWANLHGAFVIGQLAAACWFGAALLRRENRAIASAVVAAAVIAPIANPAGLELLAYAYGQPATEVVTAISVEWQPSWPWIPIATPFWAILGAVAVGRLTRRLRAPAADLLLVALLAMLAISAIRHIPWFLLAALPLVAADIDRLLTTSTRLRRSIGDVPAALRGAGAVRTLGLIGVIVVGFQLIRPVLPSGVARLTPDEPVAAVDVLRTEAEPGDRILNEQVWGGFLAYELAPDLETAMDGRLEIRSRDTWAAYFALMQGRGRPARDLAKQQVTWALIGRDRDELRGALLGAGWTLVEDDGYGVLLRGPE